jgi:hypothetical protein
MAAMRKKVKWKLTHAKSMTDCEPSIWKAVGNGWIAVLERYFNGSKYANKKERYTGTVYSTLKDPRTGSSLKSGSFSATNKREASDKAAWSLRELGIV